MGRSRYEVTTFQRWHIDQMAMNPEAEWTIARIRGPLVRDQALRMAYTLWHGEMPLVSMGYVPQSRHTGGLWVYASVGAPAHALFVGRTMIRLLDIGIWRHAIHQIFADVRAEYRYGRRLCRFLGMRYEQTIESVYAGQDYLRYVLKVK